MRQTPHSGPAEPGNGSTQNCRLCQFAYRATGRAPTRPIFYLQPDDISQTSSSHQNLFDFPLFPGILQVPT
jgi:hypothetical protein